MESRARSSSGNGTVQAAAAAESVGRVLGAAAAALGEALAGGTLATFAADVVASGRPLPLLVTSGAIPAGAVAAVPDEVPAVVCFVFGLSIELVAGAEVVLAPGVGCAEVVEANAFVETPVLLSFGLTAIGCALAGLLAPIPLSD